MLALFYFFRKLICRRAALTPLSRGGTISQEIRQRSPFMRYEFLVETYETERIKVLSVWSEFRDQDLPWRPRADDPRGRSVREQLVHQCVSEDLWFRTMLFIMIRPPP